MGSVHTAAHWTVKIVAILCARAAYGPTGPEPLWLQAKDPTTSATTRLSSWTHHVLFSEDELELMTNPPDSYDPNTTMEKFWTTSTKITGANDSLEALTPSPSGVASVPTILSAHGVMLSFLLIALSAHRTPAKRRRPSKESLRKINEKSLAHQHMNGIDKAERRRNSGTRIQTSCSLKKKTPMGVGQR